MLGPGGGVSLLAVALFPFRYSRAPPRRGRCAAIRLAGRPVIRAIRGRQEWLSPWMGVLPPELVKAHTNLDDDVIAGLPRSKPIVVA